MKKTLFLAIEIFNTKLFNIYFQQNQKKFNIEFDSTMIFFFLKLRNDLKSKNLNSKRLNKITIRNFLSTIRINTTKLLKKYENENN